MAAADPFRHHGDLQGVCARADGDAVRRAAVGSQARFKLGHFRAEHELAMAEHRLQPRTQRRLYALLLRLEVQEGDRLFHYSVSSGTAATAPLNSGTSEPTRPRASVS